MPIVTATGTSVGAGLRIETVRRFVAAQGDAMAARVKSPEDWAPVAEFVAVSEFKRVGAYLEELDWSAYTSFLTGWASGGTRFEMTEFHITEVGETVFQEIEERHFRGDQIVRKNVIAVYRFTPAGKIHHLDIYEQANDSGEWIKEAAKAAMGEKSAPQEE